MHRRFPSVLVATCLLSLGGCISPQTLQTRTDASLAPCLHAGMSTDAADGCAKRAGLALAQSNVVSSGYGGNGGRVTGQRRSYVRSVPDFYPITYSYVYLDLFFSPSGELLTWGSRAGIDGP